MTYTDTLYACIHTLLTEVASGLKHGTVVFI